MAAYIRKSQKGILKKHNKYNCLGENHEDYLKEYRVWNAMKRRCYNPNCDMYYCYGGRGIKVCDRWLDKKTGFINFYNDMGKRPIDENGKAYQIDRINVDGDYCPENCKWVPAARNARNRRDNVIFLINGESMCLKDVAKLFRINRNSVPNRIKRNGENKYVALYKVLEHKGYTLSPLTKERIML